MLAHQPQQTAKPNAENYRDPSDPTRATSAIKSRYLLVINIPLYADASGRLFADQLWYKDLVAHLSYIRDFTIACPIVQSTPPQGAISLSDQPYCARLKIVALPSTKTLMQAVALLPVTLSRLWQAISRADLVHSGIAGWPFPLGWFATPLAWLLHKRTLIIVESAPWRLQHGLPANLKAKITSRAYERLARWCVRSADLAIFTQEEYRRSLSSRRADTVAGHVIHASWIDEDIIISDQHAEQTWHQKVTQASSQDARFLFAGRLEAEKGILVLLEAISLLSKKNATLQLDILGTGRLTSRCKAVSDDLKGRTRVHLLGTVDYGDPLFRLLQQYHAVIVPSISDEQPRIVYDSYSQAVPIIGTSTSGLRDCVKQDQTGWLVCAGDVPALAGALERGLKCPDELKNMGIQAAKAARTMTHQAMHRKRQELLLRLLDE